MPVVDKREIARVLKEIAFFIRFTGGSHSTAKMYQKAAEALLGLSETLTVPVPMGPLATLPHIGPAMAQVIAELILTGRSTVHQQVRQAYPSTLAQLGEIPGLTPKQIYLLYRDAGVRSLADLRRALRHSDQVLNIPNFGPHILAALRKTLNE